MTAPSEYPDRPAARAPGRITAFHRASPQDLPYVIAHLLAGRGARSAAVPGDLPPEWLTALPPAMVLRPEGPDLTPRRLSGTDAAITGCALAVAETGDVALVNGGVSQGGEALSRVPVHHICVLYPTEVVGTLADASRLLASGRDVTWIAAPPASAHPGPTRGIRTLDVVMVTETGTSAGP